MENDETFRFIQDCKFNVIDYIKVIIILNFRSQKSKKHALKC